MMRKRINFFISVSVTSLASLPRIERQLNSLTYSPLVVHLLLQLQSNSTEYWVPIACRSLISFTLLSLKKAEEGIGSQDCLYKRLQERKREKIQTWSSSLLTSNFITKTNFSAYDLFAKFPHYSWLGSSSSLTSTVISLTVDVKDGVSCLTLDEKGKMKYSLEYTLPREIPDMTSCSSSIDNFRIKEEGKRK